MIEGIELTKTAVENKLALLDAHSSLYFFDLVNPDGNLKSSIRFFYSILSNKRDRFSWIASIGLSSNSQEGFY